jgi:hypothetical protein
VASVAKVLSDIDVPVVTRVGADSVNYEDLSFRHSVQTSCEPLLLYYTDLSVD